jgi:hypothetical protein
MAFERASAASPAAALHSSVAFGGCCAPASPPALDKGRLAFETDKQVT